MESDTSGRERWFHHLPLVLIFLLHRCKVSLTAVLNSGFLDEVGMGLEPTILSDLDPSLVLIIFISTSSSFSLPASTVADPGGCAIWPPALAPGASDSPAHRCRVRGGKGETGGRQEPGRRQGELFSQLPRLVSGTRV